MAKMISVKAVEGRVARTAPDGEFIPHDRFVPVLATHYVMRLLEVHGDIELEPTDKPEPTPPVEDEPVTTDRKALEKPDSNRQQPNKSKRKD